MSGSYFKVRINPYKWKLLQELLAYEPLAPERAEWYFRLEIFKRILVIDDSDISD